MRTTAGKRDLIGRRPSRLSRHLDTLLLVCALALGVQLLFVTHIKPGSRRAATIEARAQDLEQEVAALTARATELREQIHALQSDPWTIERALRRTLRRLRPDLFKPQGRPEASG